ncbi:unnamed protein product [Cuscuta epithymum]|uniref:Zinc finger PMZ-type domain-containing protein n=1 Tax=Cuscuta epithymum TaxID=186058 RepID=A0AAV0G1T2_9ASTE|nr:unnamed protein product [Cuscuta epithymum]
MLEDIRLKCMNRIKVFKVSFEKWVNDWSPSSMEFFLDNKDAATGCKVIYNGDVGFEIGEGRNKHTVFIDKEVCTCRTWDLTGIPRSHVICALHYNKENPNSHISMWYHKSLYKAAYEHSLQPVPGKMFMRIHDFEPIEPPYDYKHRQTK